MTCFSCIIPPSLFLAHSIDVDNLYTTFLPLKIPVDSSSIFYAGSNIQMQRKKCSQPGKRQREKLFGKIRQPPRSIGSLDPKAVPKAIGQMLTALESEHILLDMQPRKPLGT